MNKKNSKSEYTQGILDSITMLVRLIAGAEENPECVFKDGDDMDSQLIGMKQLLSMFVVVGAKELGVKITKCAFAGFDENGDEIHGDLVTGEIQRPYKEQ